MGATVYGIVKSHRGSIEIVDPPGRSTSTRVAQPRADDDEAAAPPAQARADDRAAPRGEGLVLLVDDLAVVRMAFQRALVNLGYDVVTAADGEEAVAVFQERHRDIVAVLLDMRMPRLDGRAAFLIMKDIDPDVRVLLTTGDNEHDDAAAMLALGVRAVLPKPSDLARLGREIAAIARR